MEDVGMAAGGRNKSGMDDAKRNKADEFYTRLPDIEAELRHYRPHFKGATVLCNCDDPYESNFFKYFALNFRRLGLKKLIAACYSPSPVQGLELALFDLAGMSAADATAKRPYKIEITEIPDANNDGAVDLWDVEYLLKHDANVLTVLQGNGDFRSAESVELLKQADIVVTNPPFSLSREYVAQLMEHDKKFLIIGNMHAITYKEIWPYIVGGKIWLGVTRAGSGQMWFRVQEDFPVKTGQRTDEQGNRYQTIGNSAWFTNLDHSKRHENLILVEKYSPDRYPEYDNYDGIEVRHVTDIPEDWDGVMGVPITFLGKHNPEQFEIVGIAKAPLGSPSKTYPRQTQVSKTGVESQVTKLNDGPALKVSTPPQGKTYYIVDGEYYVQKFARILIRRIGATS
jgi:hypothetical protein